MAITQIRIHPAIGIARLGNSPDEFFLAPESLGVPDIPPGGYKDSSCRIKRQAARFRLFAYDGNTLVGEITAAEADITWTVELANTKPAALKFVGGTERNPGVPRADLRIKPGPRSLTHPNQAAAFDNGTVKFLGMMAGLAVPLGEIRTDSEGRLLVLGGRGQSASPTSQSLGGFADSDGWYDDASDGPVHATVKLKGSGEVVPVLSAWVVVAPPKFAPGIDHVITLHDRIFELARSKGWRSVPANPSLREEIYPLLRCADRVRWVNESADAHGGWAEIYPMNNALRAMIFNKLRNPLGGGGNMPQLWSENLSVDQAITIAQYTMMTSWKDGNFTDDMGAPPPDLTPQRLDRVALDHCVGAALFPGIEAGRILIDKPEIWLQPFEFRLDPTKLEAGDLTARMALPWQSDFNACNDLWWPAHRPNQVRPQSAPATYQEWSRGVSSNTDMVSKWHTLGFVEPEADKFLEVERCNEPYVLLLTSKLVFQDVPSGPGGMARTTARAVSFEVSAPGGPVTIEFVSGPAHPRLKRATGNSVVVGPTGTSPVIARLWITYTTGLPGESLTDEARFKIQGGTQEWKIPIAANTVERKKSAAALVLDRSGSMSQDRGDGGKKIDSLLEAGNIFVDVMLPDDGLTLVRYNQDAQTLLPFTVLGSPLDPFDPGRTAAKGHFTAGSPTLSPSGSTSIGDGIHQGRLELDPVAGFDVKALVVLTDGKENEPAWIADVAGDINAQTYAVGLGKPQDISVASLQKIAGNHGGYLVVTGPLTTDNQFQLKKFFLQILAGISNAEVVLDPQETLDAGEVRRIPFDLSEADAGFDAILLTPFPALIEYQLETPNGILIDPALADTAPGAEYVESGGVSFYRVVLPFFTSPGRPDQGGRWHAVLRLRRERRSLPYSFMVHSYTDLRLRTWVHQDHWEPGAEVLVRATLTEYEIPIERRGRVWAEVERPDGSRFQIDLDERDPGEFWSRFATSLAGLYRIRVRAQGETLRGLRFQRERTLTAQVWEGGNRDDGRSDTEPGQPGLTRRPRPEGAGIPPSHDEDRCCERLLACLLAPGVISPELQRRLLDWGLDLSALRACLEERPDAAGPVVREELRKLTPDLLEQLRRLLEDVR